MPDPAYRLSRERAYEELKKLTGEDFGYDDKLWEEWGFRNEMFITPPRFLKYMSNLRRQLSNESAYYMSHAEAYDKLKEMSGQDFGDNCELWEEWGRANGYLR